MQLEFFQIAQDRVVFRTNLGDCLGLIFRRFAAGQVLEDFEIGRAGFEVEKG